jgi:hypothetical protein
VPLTITATSTEFVTLDELKSHLNITANRDNAELDMVKGAAQDAVTHLIGPVLHRTVTETVWSRGGIAVLSYAPVVSVTTLFYALTNPVTATLHTDAGVLSDVDFNGALTAVYVAGRTVVPDAVRLATLIIAGHIWDLQRGTSPSALQGEEPEPQMGLGYAIPNRATDLLAPYRLAPTVA